MRARTIAVTAALGSAVVLGLGGAAWATAGGGRGGDDEDASVTGPGADRAGAAAIAHLGGGAVRAVERESEDGETWEVEFTKGNGETVDVYLDANYRVAAVEGDSETEGGSKQEGGSKHEGGSKPEDQSEQEDESAHEDGPEQEDESAKEDGSEQESDSEKANSDDEAGEEG